MSPCVAVQQHSSLQLIFFTSKFTRGKNSNIKQGQKRMCFEAFGKLRDTGLRKLMKDQMKDERNKKVRYFSHVKSSVFLTIMESYLSLGN